jgi:HPt (histidine-containing phosphotransfer) domain-containing protein
VDLVDATSRLGLPEESLLKLLARFPAGARRTIEDLREALESGDAEEARRHAHSLAGAAGNFSVEIVRRLAKTLELAIKAGTGDYEKLFAELCTEAERTLAAIDQACGAAAAPAPTAALENPPAADPEPARLFLGELADQLDSGDPDAAVRLLAELERVGLPPAAVAELRQLVDDFEFGAAAARARELAAAV